MRRIINLIICILPMLLLSQDSTVVKPWIELDTVVMRYQKIATNTIYEFAATVDVEPYVLQYFNFIDEYNIDPSMLKNYSGIWTVNDISDYAENDNTLAITFKAMPKLNVKSMTLIDANHNIKGLELRTLVFHELTHLMTNNRLPHCKDWVNCSSIFYTHLEGIQGRVEKFWEMEKEQLANQILIYQKYNGKYKDK